MRNDIRMGVLAIVGIASVIGGNVRAQDKSADKTVTKSDAKAAPIMQLKLETQGDFLYRFVGKDGASGAPTPLPAATNGVVALPLPADLKPDHASLEVRDKGHGNLALLPVKTDGMTTLNESGFGYVQTLYVPVQSKGKPVTDAQVQVSGRINGLDKATATHVLEPSDNGIARFDSIGYEPIVITVKYGANAPKSVTETLSRTHPADGIHHEPILVDWPDAKTVDVPAPVAPPAAGTVAPAAPVSAPTTAPPPAPASSNPFGPIISILVLAGVGYGVYWAYTNGKLKSILDRAGIETGTLAAQGANGANPFTSPAQPAIAPITEGTTDPFSGGAIGGLGGSAAIASNGPRLVATAGTYSGTIFPLNGTSTDVGRDANNPVALPNDTQVSRRHVTIQNNGGQYLLTDNGSSNGTFVNGVRIPGSVPQPMRPGDEINIGNTRFRFEA